MDTLQLLSFLLGLSSVPPCTAQVDVVRPALQFERTVQDMWQRSPTFRRQVARLSGAALIVTIDTCGGDCLASVRGQTTMTFAHGAVIRAHARIRSSIVEVPELIAHELEHVIEQLDGVDLARLARQGNHVIRTDARGPYETARANSIGRAVASEYRTGGGLPVACERRTP
jgi:hypothetical protein